MGNIIMGIIRILFFALDKIIYNFIPTLYEFIYVLANQQIFKDSIIQTLAGNLYAILGIFMLFRLAFVLLNAIIDPDKLTNKDKGFAKIISRLIIALGLIALIPWAFEYAFKLQNVILEKEIINKVIFGTSDNINTTAGDTIARETFSAFITYKGDGTTPVTECDLSASPIDSTNPTCALITDFNNAFSATTSSTGWSGLKSKINEKTDSGDDFAYDYNFGISTVCGIFILYLLISFSIDIGVRTVKLSFLQLITPVAAIGYVEPDGGIFKRWMKLCVNTYLNLFIRLIAIAFVAFIIKQFGVGGSLASITDSDGNVINGTMATFVKVFIIIGCLIFAKQAPKFISEILGIKDSGFDGLSPFKKLGAMAGAGVIGGATALGLKGAAGLAGMGRGGVSSLMRGGSFGAGAIKGGAAAMKNVPFGKDFGAQAKGALTGAWRKAANAGASSATGKEEHTGLIAGAKQKINNAATSMEQNASYNHEKDLESAMNTGGAKKFFKDTDLANAYNAFAGPGGTKDKLKGARDTFNGYQRKYQDDQLRYNNASNEVKNANDAFMRTSQTLKDAVNTRNAAQAQAKSLEDVRNKALADKDIVKYSMADKEYNNYISSSEYKDALSNYTTANNDYASASKNLSDAETEFTSARTSVLSSQKDFLDAQNALPGFEKANEAAEKKFNTILEQPGNKKDSENYKTYKKGIDSGRISKP